MGTLVVASEISGGMDHGGLITQTEPGWESDRDSEGC